MQTFLKLNSRKHKNSENEKQTRFVNTTESIGIFFFKKKI